MPPRLQLDLHAADPAPWWGMGEVVRLAVPSVLNTVSFTIMQFVDGWMVSRVSAEALSAQFIGGITAFTPICFFIGLVGCVSTFASQNLGAGRKDRAALFGWQGLWVAWAAAAVLALLVPAAPTLLGLYGHAADVTVMETQYFQILVGGAVFNLSARALGSWFIGIHRPKMTLLAGVTGNLVNLVGNYLFIYGMYGFPKLGLVGAGIGTVLGSAAEAAVLLTAFLAGPTAAEYAVRLQRRVSREALVELLRIGSPAGGMFLADVLVWAIFMGRIIGGFGTEALAAAAILNRYWHLCFMPAIGVSNAVSAIVGRRCGAGRQDLAWRRAHAGLALVMTYMVTCGTVIWFGREFFVGLFNETGGPVVQSIATSAVFFILLCQAFDALNVTFIGALRGAGDTLWPGVVQVILAYGLGLGGSALVAHLKPEWGSLGPWGMASAYIMLLGLAMWGRFLSGGWRRIKLVEEAPAIGPEEPVSLPPG